MTRVVPARPHAGADTRALLARRDALMARPEGARAELLSVQHELLRRGLGGVSGGSLDALPALPALIAGGRTLLPWIARALPYLLSLRRYGCTGSGRVWLRGAFACGQRTWLQALFGGWGPALICRYGGKDPGLLIDRVFEVLCHAKAEETSAVLAARLTDVVVRHAAEQAAKPGMEPEAANRPMGLGALAVSALPGGPRRR